jgi:hypothetical protein
MSPSLVFALESFMVRPTDLPVVHPTYEHRPLRAAEVIELAHNRPVAGVNPDDPLMKAIGRLNPGVIMNGIFREARQQGYLLALSPDGYDRQGDISDVIDLWSWWCAAAGHPEICMQAEAEGTYRVRVDLGTTGSSWNLSVFRLFARMLKETIGDLLLGDSWLFTEDVFEVNHLDHEQAISVTRGVLDICLDQRFRVSRTAW